MTRLLGHDPEMLERRPLADIVAESRPGSHARRASAASQGRRRHTRSPARVGAASATTAPSPSPSS